MVQLGRQLGFARIEAICHVDHELSVRVLEKAGLSCEGTLGRHSVFPNLTAAAQHVRSYAWTSPD
jgi:RimJ/RimL family protein N-acetyltransferase